jgi:hypothetical protein
MLIERTSPAFFFFSLSRQKGETWPVSPQAWHSLPTAGKVALVVKKAATVEISTDFQCATVLGSS